MKLTSNNMKKLLLLITFGILLFLGLSHIQPVLSFVRYLFALISPFLIGLCIAFILNVPLRFFERLLFRRPGAPHSLKERLRRPVSLTVTLLAVLGVIAVVMFMVIPELAETLIIGQPHPLLFRSDSALDQRFGGALSRIDRMGGAAGNRLERHCR